MLRCNLKLPISTETGLSVVTMQDIDVWGSHGNKVDHISASDMVDRSKLLTLDHVRGVLATTEPCDSVGFPVSSDIDFKLEKGWNYEAKDMAGTDLVSAYVTIHGKEYQMSKDAILETASLCGISKAYALKTPAGLIEPHLRFWYRGGLDESKEYKALTVGGDKCLAVMKATINPFSNLRLLEESLNSIEAKYGEGEVFVDPKFEHSLRRTHLRLVVPEYLRQMTGTNEDNDNWSIGVQVLNSLIGEQQTSFDGYMFRWLCTNGAIDTFANSSRWSRKSGGQGDEVYEWARSAVDEVLGGLEHSLDLVQESANIAIAKGDVKDALQEIFDTFAIPGQARQLVIDNMIEEDNLTMYHVMQAITAAANSPEVDPNHVLGLMEAGGSLPRVAHNRCGSCKRFTTQIHSH